VRALRIPDPQEGEAAGADQQPGLSAEKDGPFALPPGQPDEDNVGDGGPGGGETERGAQLAGVDHQDRPQRGGQSAVGNDQ
jgi:hypothetical protein